MNLLQLDMRSGGRATMRRKWNPTWGMMMSVCALVCWLSACNTPELADRPLTTESDSLSYAIGMNIGYNYRMQGIELDPAIMAIGFKAIQDSAGVKLTRDQMAQVIQSYARRNQQKIQAKLNLNRQLAAATTKVRSQKFLEANGQREGVVTLGSGIQYEVLKSGEGRTPTQEDRIFLHYVGTDIDGNLYANTYQTGEPAEATVEDLLPGQVQILQMMKEGDKWKVYIPATLGHGVAGSEVVPPEMALIFEMELVEVIR